MELITLFHIPDGKPRTIAATAWHAMQGTPRARNYKEINPAPKAPKPPEVVALEAELEAKDQEEKPKATKNNSRYKKNI